jgi:hypothetical protein
MKSIALGILGAGLVAATAQAQTPAAAPKRVTIVVGADAPLLTGYVFRGIVQEFDPKLTLQPYVDVGIAVNDRTTVNVGSWNSFHSGSNQKTPYDGSFYESDLYASVTFVAGKWKPGVLYTLYTSPNGGYKGVGPDGSIGVSELAVFASFDDSANRVPLSPKVVLAFETTDTQADFGARKGTYLEAGVAPSVKTTGGPPVTLTVPVKLGLSLKDYFEVAGDDNTFGYLQFGGRASVPLSFVTSGSWEAHAGLDIFVFGEKRKVQQAGDSEAKSVKPVFNVGFSATF